MVEFKWKSGNQPEPDSEAPKDLAPAAPQPPVPSGGTAAAPAPAQPPAPKQPDFDAVPMKDHGVIKVFAQGQGLADSKQVERFAWLADHLGVRAQIMQTGLSGDGKVGFLIAVDGDDIAIGKAQAIRDILGRFDLAWKHNPGEETPFPTA